MEIDVLRHALSERTPQRRTRPKVAAVLVPIIQSSDGLHLLLTRRADTLSSHRGEVAFPGGGVEPADQSLVETALREATEEVALPSERVEVLGQLDDFPTLGDRTIVTPIVGLINGFPELHPEPAEVARIFTIPIAELEKSDGWTIRSYSQRGHDFPVFYFDWDGETLWGLSAYITLQLLSLNEGGGPCELPPPYGP